MLGLGQILLEEPLLDRCEWHWSDHLCLLPSVGGQPQPYGACDHRQLSNGRVLKELFERQLPQPRLSSMCNNQHTENGVASQSKEVLMNTHLRPNPQHLLPDSCQRAFDWLAGSHKGAFMTSRSGRDSGLHLSQSIAIHLPVGCQWQGFQKDDIRRYH